MRAAIAGTVDHTCRSLEHALLCWDVRVLPDVTNADDLARLQSDLEEASILVVDLSMGATPYLSWVIGAASIFGIPVVVLAPGIVPDMSILLWSVVTVKSTIFDVQVAVNSLLQAMDRGVEDYAQVAAELHAKFRETL